jgi:spermidine synthase
MLFNEGQIIHHSRDKFGNILVIDYRKDRVLTFDSMFEQSKIDRQHPYLPVHEYSRAMLLPVAFNRPNHVTLLGLGGGVTANAFLHLLPECRVHVVELRQAVLNVARDYFELSDSERLTVTIANARHALNKLPDASTNMILSDLYSAHRMSPLQVERQFVENSSRSLTSDGWLVMNYHRKPDLDGLFFQQLRKHFAELLVFKSKTNNTIVYASKRPFELIHPGNPIIVNLEKHLPIGWGRLLRRINRL